MISNALADSSLFSNNQVQKGSDDFPYKNVEEIIDDIESNHCPVSKKIIEMEKLTPEMIKKAKEFCSLSRNQKTKLIKEKIEKAQNPIFAIASNSNFYSCGNYTNIPTYARVGVTSSSCSWTDTSHSANCRVQNSTNSISCLWGCTNKDPVLSWTSKYFPSVAAAEANIKPKGYVLSYGYNRSYSRNIGYGYRYEVQGPPNAPAGGTWTNEGPEPEPNFNFPGYQGGWWPNAVANWHAQC